MLKVSAKEPTMNKVCLKHNYYVVKQVEPSVSKKQNGYKIYKCKKCNKKHREIISYKNYWEGDF